MRYIPNLIPQESKVLPDYFKDPDNSNQPNNKKPSFFWLIVAILFIMITALFFGKVLVAFFYISILLIFTRKGKNWIEHTGRFIIAPRIRLVFCSVLVLLSIPTWIFYQNIEDQNNALKEQKHQQARKFTADSLKNDNLRKDSLQYFLTKIKNVSPEQGLLNLKIAEKYVLSQDEKDSLKQVIKKTSLRLVQKLEASSKYKAVLNILDKLIEEYPKDKGLLYDRGACYIKLGSIGLAATDLKLAQESGDARAVKLYNKVNPIRRRIAYHVTRCCDGSTSNASGRGACSWHGGVCNWDEPVYETYRRY